MQLHDGATTTGPSGVSLLTLPGVKAVQSYEGDESPLASGQLELILVTLDPATAASDPFQDPTSGAASDVWLVITLGPDFSLPLHTTQVVTPIRESHRTSYVLPSLDVPGASVSLVTPYGTSTQPAPAIAEQIEELESLLSQYCAFQSEDRSDAGAIELQDEAGNVIGRLQGKFDLREDPAIHARGGEKEPVLIDLEELEPGEKHSAAAAGKVDANVVHVRPLAASDAAGQDQDWILRGATLVSTGIIKGSAVLGNAMHSAASTYIKRTTPNQSGATTPTGTGEKGSERALSESRYANTSSGSSSLGGTTSGRKPLTFSSSTHRATATTSRFSSHAVKLSNEATKTIMNVAAGAGSKIGKATGIQAKAPAPGAPVQQPKGIRGVINRSLIAASTVLDGIEKGAERVLTDAGSASGRAIEHRYGTEARVVSAQVGSVGRGAFLVYKDLNGIRRRCLLKVASGAYKAKLDDGREVILQPDDAGNVDLDRNAQSVGAPSPSSNAVAGASSSNNPPPYAVAQQQQQQQQQQGAGYANPYATTSEKR